MQESVKNDINDNQKIAICISGNIRNFEIESLKEFISNMNTTPDVFITTWNWKYITIPITHEKNGYVTEDMFDDINVKDICINEWSPALSATELNGWGSNANKPVVNTFEMKIQYENKYNFKYDIVYKTRLDVKYIDLKFDIPAGYENYLIQPNLCNWNGHYMWEDYPSGGMFYASSNNMDKVYNRYKLHIMESEHSHLRNCGLPVYPHPGKIYLHDWRNILRAPEDQINLQIK